MELQFQKKEVLCLKPVLCQLQNLEQTQEVRIPEGQSGAERVLACWGQAVLRSKEWRTDSLQITGGVTVWLLYQPEDGGEPRKLEVWVPFQTMWDLPPDTPEGQARVLCLLRFADARVVTPGKLLLRAGVAAFAECWVPESCPVWSAQALPEGVELLENTYPMDLCREVGEKTFSLEESWRLPASDPAPQALVACQLQIRTEDSRILTGRLVFRGTGVLRTVYRTEEGQLRSWEFPLSFSQFADLGEEMTGQARAELLLGLTNVEAELDAEGSFRLRAALTAQYAVEERQMIAATMDAYCLHRELQLRRQSASFPVLLERQEESLRLDLPAPEGGNVVDISSLPDFPRLRRQNGRLRLEQPGVSQLLYYDAEGRLQSVLARWEAEFSAPADENVQVQAFPGPVAASGQGTAIRLEIPETLRVSTDQAISAVSGLSLGEELEKGTDRPSLILCRPAGRSLWELAKASGSRVRDIRSLNELAGEPEPDRLLLIPVL